MRYRNLVFDVGHVLLSYRWKEMMVDYGMTPKEAEDFYDMMFHDPLWLEFDLENWSYEEVAAKFIEKNPSYAEEIRYFLYHRELMPVARPGVYERIEKLMAQGRRICILSNYSSVLFDAHTKLIPFMDRILGKMVSCMIHIGKPDRRIYEALYRECDILPAESLFFDDRPENIEGAAATGMDGILVTSEEQLEQELDHLLTDTEK